MTIREALAAATTRLDRQSVPSSRFTAEVLLGHVLDLDLAGLYTHTERTLTSVEAGHFDRLIDRRSEGVPLQYLTGVQEFFGRTFAVNPHVLIPRPETELIIETIKLWPGPDPVIVDIGTGSGCIAVSAALERRCAAVVATDISTGALRTARKNAANLGAPVHFVQMDMLEGLGDGFDIIASNPPYVSDDDLQTLPREVRDHEPPAALFSGDGGRAHIRRLVRQSWQRLRPGGWLVFEIGFGMAERVMELLVQPWQSVEILPDLAGIQRIVIARKSG